MTNAGAPVVMLASGTRGDVQPFVALALGLRQAGIPAVIAAASRFRPLVEDRGIGFLALEGNPSDLMAAGPGAMAASLRGGAARGAVTTVRFLAAAQAEFRRMLESAATICGIPAATICGIPAAAAGPPARPPARAILVGLASTWGFSIAEALGVPCVPCMLQPFGRTRAFPSALVPSRLSLGGGYNALSYRLVEQAMWLPWRRATNAWRRRTLGLPPLPAAGPWGRLYAGGFPCLYGFSPAVLRPPPDWPSDHVVTGYWFLDETPGWAPRPALERFLSFGAPPLYVGFGSMGVHGGMNVLGVFAEALERSGLRAVVCAGGGAGHPLPTVPAVPTKGTSRMFFESEVPHSWLFPRMAAAVHHGGAGTTAEALRAGVPSLIYPTAADQHFWGRRVERLGAGPPPIGPRDMTPGALARLFTRMATDRVMREKARLLGERIRAENGVAGAVEALLALLGPRGFRARRRASS